MIRSVFANLFAVVVYAAMILFVAAGIVAGIVAISYIAHLGWSLA